MLLEVRNISPDVTLALWQTSEPSSEMLSQLAQRDFYRPYFDRIKTEKRRREWTASKLLAERVCGIGKRVVYDANGKPSIEDGSFHVSISHTMDYVAFVASRRRAVGVDIEKIGDKALGLKERFMTAEELRNLDAENALCDVLMHWCAKEAAFKMNDERAVVYDDYHVSKQETDFEKSFDFQTVWKDRIYKMHYCRFADFVMVYAMENDV